MLASLSLIISGCLEIEEGISLNEDGSGMMEIKTDMSELMGMMAMMGGGKSEKINKDTIISYKSYLDTAQSLNESEKNLLRNATWNIKMNSDEGVMYMTLKAPFKNPGEVNEIMAVLKFLIRQNKTGKNAGKRSIWFNGKNTKAQTEHVKPQFEKYVATNFNRILKDNPDKTSK